MSERQKPERLTANELFKSRFSAWFWAALTGATLLHAAVFLTSPRFGTQALTYVTTELSTVELPKEIPIPPPPAAIARPATPVMVRAAEVADQDLTIAPTTFEMNPVETLPPPPSGSAKEEATIEAAPTFTPMTVRPALKNGAEIAELLVTYYPPMLRNASIGGVVTVWFFIDETGRVQRTLVKKSSGYDAFDEAALKVADRMRFSPAYNRDRPVKVWVSLEIRFETLK